MYRRPSGLQLSKTHGCTEHAISLRLIELFRPLRDVAPANAKRFRYRALGSAEEGNRFRLGHGLTVYARKHFTSTPVNRYVATVVSMTFTKRFNEAFAELGISNAQFARDTGMERANVSHWRNGRVKAPEAKSVVAAAKRLGVNFPWLMDGSGPKRPELPSMLETMGEVDGMEMSQQAMRVARAFMDLGRRRRDEIERQILVEAMREAGSPLGNVTTITPMLRDRDKKQ